MRRIAAIVFVGLSFIWFGACRQCSAQQIIGRPMLPLGLDCGSFTAQTASFSGTQLMRKAGALTALSDSKVFTVSMWIKRTDTTSGTKAIIVLDNGPTVRFQINIQNNKLTCSGVNAAGSTILDFQTTTAFTTSWIHVLVAIDLANSSNRHIYFNGVEDGSVTWTTYTNDTLDLSPASPTSTFGANHLDNNKQTASIAEFWMDDVYLNDPTKFICTSSGTHPISLGATGNLPNGSAPAVYFSLNGSGNSWATDSSGNGNTMTVTGTLGSTTSP